MTNRTHRTERPGFVDSHVHLWDLGTGWYRHIVAADESVGLGPADGLKRDYLLGDYRADTACVRLEKFVHVSAAFPKDGPALETRWLDELADRCGAPHAIVGTLDLRKGTADVERQLDIQMESARFRGIRMTLGLPYQSELGRATLAMLADRALVLDVGIHPHSTIDAATRAAEANPAVSFVLEHMGAPPAPPPLLDSERVSQWRRDVAAFASLGNTVCKLSGIAMTFHRYDIDAFRPYLDHCLEVFGTDRCMFGSNFPVDRLYGNFEALISIYSELISDLPSDDRHCLMVANAERIYRI